jgi:predicted transcriptional regulator
MGVTRQPTPAELEILRILWRHGRSSVRDVQERMEAIRPTGYTTVLKLMQIMTEKGLVRRDESARAHVYEATAPEQQTQRQLVKDLVDRAFGGSASRLVMQALSEKSASREDLVAIRALIDRLEEEK